MGECKPKVDGEQESIPNLPHPIATNFLPSAQVLVKKQDSSFTNRQVSWIPEKSTPR